ncbi:FIST N-terminal domain-containing protein [Actinoplanes palleronii]|uniref:FIST domain containing protein n=1 Tax=Actinoplanes palleronii TaxID=113570 RepID=A0ABQ4BBS3_9ACTN|nr:FIST N-terminal domain-containing protein [Actinoplanes palleronii]GIE68106.1 hypothetical protein Apa02nite_042140 [Actinoplanes palleronii]
MVTTTLPRSGQHIAAASAASHLSDGAAAVAEIAAALGSRADLYTVFVSTGYDLEVVGTALKQHFGDRVIGCTSSGNIGPNGYDRTGICAAALAGGGLRARTITVGPLDDTATAVEEAGSALAGLRAELAEDGEGFAVLLTDGLSRNEDLLAANLMATLGDVPIVGGSAGDDLTFAYTAVYHDGKFLANTATVTLVRADAPFRLLRLQHHDPTDTILVATEVDADRRIIREFNGRPAAVAYAEAVGADLADIGPTTFSTHPLLLNAGGSSWIRSIATVNEDRSLSMFARVDTGDVLRLGHPVGMLQKLAERFDAVSAELGSISAVLTFDCILRRLEFEERGLADEVGAFLAKHRAIGFSTYGEQFNGMHMNQTLVAVAFG